MAIEFVGASNGGVSNGTTASVPVPVGIADGDILVAIISGNQYQPPALPAGWSARSMNPYHTRPWLLGVAYKPITNAMAEVTPYAFTGGAPYKSIVILGFRGCDTSNPFATIADTVVGVDSLDSTTVTVGGVTTTVDNAYLLMGAVRASSGGYTISANGMTLLGHRTSDLYTAALGESLGAEGPTGNRTAVFNGIQHTGIILTALRPADSDPPGPTARPWSRGFVVE